MHGGGRLVIIIAKHINDIKVAGETSVGTAFRTHLERELGELTFESSDFVNCGVGHQQDPATHEVKLSQQYYALKLQLTNSRESIVCPDQAASVKIKGQYMCT